MKTKLIDCFPFNNELLTLELRLETLWDKVDHFILCEANRTQTLLPKEFHFDANKEKFKKYSSKIIHVKLDQFPAGSEGTWRMENFQRNALISGFAGIDMDLFDRVMLSDVDEIPNPERIPEEAPNYPITFNHSFHCYFYDLFAPNKAWKGTVLSSFKDFRNVGPQGIRNMKDQLDSIDSGWHMSWICSNKNGGREILKKMTDNIEPMNKAVLPKTPEEMAAIFEKEVLGDNPHFLVAEDFSNNDTRLSIMPENLLPQYIIENPKKFSKFLFPLTKK